MGLEQLNITGNLPLMQGMDGAGVATGGASQDPLLFLRQLLVQLQGAAGDGPVLTPELQALLQNGQLPAATADGQNAMDALKAAMAALRSASAPAPQGQPSLEAGKPLPPVQAEAGNTLPPDWAALLAESMAAGAVAGEDGTGLGARPDKSKDGDESATEEPGVLTLNPADPQAVPVFLPSTDVAVPPQPVAIAPALPANAPDEAKAGDIDAPIAAANKQALTDHGSAHAERWTESVREGLQEGVAAPVPTADSLTGPASNRGGNSLQGQEQGFANTLATVAAAASSPVAAPIEARGTAASAPPPVATPVGQPGWGQELGDRIVWMTGKSLDSAEIHLNPPHLGPVEVRITMQHDQASVQFVSGHAAVREAIEAAMPRLREMMSDQQLALVDVNVSNQSSQQQFAGRDGGRPQHSQAFAFNEHGQGSDKDEARLAETPIAVRTSSGLLNLYA